MPETEILLGLERIKKPWALPTTGQSMWSQATEAEVLEELEGIR